MRRGKTSNGNSWRRGGKTFCCIKEQTQGKRGKRLLRRCENEEVEVDNEVELKMHMVIVKDDDIAIDAISLATKPPMIDASGLLTEKTWKLFGNWSKIIACNTRHEDEHEIRVCVDTVYPRHGYAVSSLMDTAYWLSEQYDRQHFVYLQNSNKCDLVQIHVDDIILGSTSTKIEQSERGILIKKERYVKDLMRKYDKIGSSVNTLIMPPNMLGPDLNVKAVNESQYNGMIGSLMNLTASRPDIQLSTGLYARHQANIRNPTLLMLREFLDRKITSDACQLLEGSLFAEVRISINIEPFTRSPNMYKEYLAEFWYSAKTLKNSKVSFFVPTSGIYGEIIQSLGGKTGGFDQITNKDAIILYSLGNRINIDYASIFWEDSIIKLNKRHKEKVVPYTRFLSLFMMHKMKEGYRDDHMLDIYNAAEPVVFKAPKPSSNAKRVPQGTKLRAKPRHKKHSTSSKQPFVSIKEVTKGGSFKEPTGSKTSNSKKRKESSLAIDSNLSQPLVSTPLDTGMHKEDQQATSGPTSLGSVSRNDASAVSTAEADPGKYAPNDFVPQQQGLEIVVTQHTTRKGTNSIARQVKEDEASRTIKLEDLAKLVSYEVHATTNVETEDTSVPISSSPMSSQIQELTNQVLILQSQKHKLELKKNKAEAEAALLKAQPSFPNVGKLNELRVKSLQTEFLKILSAHDFSSSLPTELKDLTSNSSQPKGEHIKKDNGKKAISLEEAEKESTNNGSNDDDDETHVTGFMVESSTTKKLKKFDFITEGGKHIHLTEEQINQQKKIEEEAKSKAAKHEREVRKAELVDLLGPEVGPVILKVYKEDGTSEVIPNFKASDLYLGEWRERKHANDIHDYFKSNKRFKSSVQYEDHLPGTVFNEPVLVRVAKVSSASALQVLRRLGSIFTSVYAAVHKLKKKVYKAGKRLLYVKKNKAISLGKGASKVVNDEDVVHHALKGLPDKYDQVCGIMHHKDTFPDLKTARSMLLIEEMRLKSKSLSLLVDSSSSSPMVLMAQLGTNRRPSNSQNKSWRSCFNFAKGSCRFGSDCKYVHDPNAKPTNTTTSCAPNTTTDELLAKLLDKLGLNNSLPTVSNMSQPVPSNIP
ncbi:pleiotropic drug resistance protein 1-like protein [Tanacetum coccineum]